MWVTLRTINDEDISLEWGYGNGQYDLYELSKAAVYDAVQGFKAPLARLTNWARTRDAAEVRSILDDIASAGLQLKTVLFQANKPTAELEEWIQQQIEAGDNRLTVTADESFHIPWGLVFDDNAFCDVRGLTESELLARMWCFKFELEVKFSSSNALRSRMKRKRESVRVVSLLNRTFSDDVQKDRQFYSLIGNPDGIAWSIKSLVELLDKAAESDTLFHFFGHGKDGGLVVDTNEFINAAQFRTLMEKITLRSTNGGRSTVGFVFLNACDSIVGQSDFSLRGAVARAGMSGMIATEAEVPRDFAIEYGRRFLAKLLEEGMTLGETVDALRKDPQLWPLSLLYGCYAVRDFQIVRDVTDAAGMAH